MKKLVSITLGLCVLAGTLSAAGQQSQSAGAGPAAQDKSPLGKYAAPISITTVKSQSDAVKFEQGEDYNNNIWIKGYKDYLNIDAKVLWSVPQAQFQQKLNISISANDLPDIIPADLRQFKQLTDYGVAQDMSAIFPAYVSPITKSMFDLDAGVALGQATIKGKLMGVPVLSGNTDTPAMLWIREDGLKKLGLAPPKTMADVIAIARAFKKAFPDSYPLGLEKLLFGGLYDLDGFFQSYRAYAGANDWIKTSSGQLVYGAVQPEVKAALAQLAALFKEGLIDPEFAVKDASKVSEFMASDRMGIFYGQHWNPFWPLQDGRNKNPLMEWKPYPLASVDGKPAMPMTYGSTGTIYVINKKLKNPEAAVKMLNLYYAKDLALSPDFDDAYHKKDAAGDQPQIPRYEYAFVQGWHPQQNLLIHRGVRDFFNGKQTDIAKMIPWVKDNVQSAQRFLAGENAGWGGYMWCGPTGAFSVIDYYWTSNLVKVSAYLGANTETMVAKNATLDKMKLETFTKIIMGAAPLSEFDTFVENWKKLGGDQITAEVNAAVK